jgi:hypothetical protein
MDKPTEIKKQPREPEESLSEVRREGSYDQINSENIIQLPEDQTTIKGDARLLDQSIPDAKYTGTTIDLNAPPPGQEAQPKPGANGPASGPSMGNNPNAGMGGFSDQQKQQQRKSFNPEFDEMPEEDKIDSSEIMADMVINGYAAFKNWIPSVIGLSDKKLNKLHKTGEINIYKRKPIVGTNQTESVGDFVSRYNKKIAKPFHTSDEFKQQVKPVLATVLKKKGVAMTPEQLLMTMVGMDFAFTVKSSIEAIMETRSMVEELREMNRNANQATAQPTTADVHQQQQTREQPKEEHRPAQPTTGAESIVTPDIIDSTLKNDKKKTDTKVYKANVIPETKSTGKKRGRPFKHLVKD